MVRSVVSYQSVAQDQGKSLNGRPRALSKIAHTVTDMRTAEMMASFHLNSCPPSAETMISTTVAVMRPPVFIRAANAQTEPMTMISGRHAVGVGASSSAKKDSTNTKTPKATVAQPNRLGKYAAPILTAVPIGY